ncbi:hypothetical protein J437_LFUL004833 [Ladona fulva]|uniref:Uncharacterized protein n=1 Tax=Ladona fulva TaxID=123851 RepID=A0A8K0P134_LADFU|nr:hypothetical protein J437_LFUL004833 [Ladona fulva]
MFTLVGQGDNNLLSEPYAVPPRYISSVPAPTEPAGASATWEERREVCRTIETEDLPHRQLHEHHDHPHPYHHHPHLHHMGPLSPTTFSATKLHRDSNLLPKINNIVIPKTHKYKYLGVILTDQLTWTEHIKYAISKSQGIKNKLFPLLTRTSPLSAANKVRLVKAFILPVITYAAVITCNTTKQNLNRLSSFYNKCVRLATSTNKLVSLREIREYHKVLTIHEFIRKLTVAISSS